MKLNPLTIRKIQRFTSIKRGYYSFVVFALITLLSLGAEVLVNNKALWVKYEGQNYFPIFSGFIPGTTFGLDYEYETDYRALKREFEKTDSGNFVILPPVPYNAYETDLKTGAYPPFPPDFSQRHFLGTDVSGRDVLARLVYGFRIAIFFSLGLLLANYVIGVSIGCAMGYFGGALIFFFSGSLKSGAMFHFYMSSSSSRPSFPPVFSC